MEGFDIMTFKDFPTIKCPHCKAWICNVAYTNAKIELISNENVITPQTLDADIIIRCTKCRKYIAIKPQKTEQSVVKSTA